MKNRKFLFGGTLIMGMALAALVFALALAGCPTGGDGGDEYTAPAPQTVEYSGADPAGNTYYHLSITKKSGGAKYAAQEGDTYVLTITFIRKSGLIPRSSNAPELVKMYKKPYKNST
jgi:hypothetical protein